jgi:hypothetical protein
MLISDHPNSNWAHATIHGVHREALHWGNLWSASGGLVLRDKTKPEKAKDGDAQTAGEGPVAVGLG